MGREILSDTGYYLDINSIFFAVLVDHINEDKVIITFDDLNKKRLQFWNCGKPCRFAFTEEILSYRINISYSPLIKYNGINSWIVDLKWLFEGAINSFREDELKYCLYNEELAKIFHLFCYLGIDLRIFDPPYHAVTNLLRCGFMFDKYNPEDEELYKLAKENNPNATNIELLSIMKKLRKQKTLKKRL